MRELIKLHNVAYDIMNVKVFDVIYASVQQGDRIGIIGKNGAGKSTLLQLINHDLEPTQGQIQRLQQDLKVVRLEQETESHTSEDMTAFEVELLEKWQVPAHEFEKLSGGEKLKARLASGFAKHAHILLLDEPTNHLDQRSKEFLIQQMEGYKGTLIFVSHDRYFLDTMATKIWSIEGNQLIEHKGNYSSYQEMRQLRRLTQQRDYEKQKKMVERIESQMDELTSWSKKAHAQSTKKEGFKEYYRVKAKRMDSQVKSKQKRLEKELEKIKVKPVEPEYTVQFSMKTSNKVGKRFLEVKNLTKSFDERILFQNANFTIQYGEKIAITGLNGCGKTTLLKIIMGEESVEGDVWISPSASIGYLTQEVFDLPLNQTPEQLFYQETFQNRGKVQNLMKHLGFHSSQWTEPIRDMSMGERVKCKLMAYILEEKDVLILDEPTNHLDLPSREQLEDTLAKYNGTLLVVSHDRYFFEKTTENKLVISNKQIQKQYSEALQKRDEIEELRLKLESERQEVLGRLSFLAQHDAAYAELDKKFIELTKQIKELPTE
ncbi:macrolide transport system ATP-binding/permease protein [Bacillus mesophilus]|uniref:Ribosome protection protein VmlR n=1 Tax=Bacillus mesophilus TaxID=1808955 RepID=A0A6M0Q5I6_9BACI|nr:ABC-F type ribosomal protection protein [Bacillus mesophilus]MBM7660338.1 macrolide transport system ATP-binding/permease protein [Bacillus mesophilus]NEY71049.1 ABC-F type ribosomal protection protein [Bacillus mesophilus]